MSKLSFENVKDWGSISEYILSLPEIRFVGIVNNMGHLITGEYNKGVVPIAGLQEYKICMEHALELVMKRDLDETLGTLDYIVSKRKSMVIITIPFYNHLVLVSAENKVKIEPLIEKILEKLK